MIRQTFPHNPKMQGKSPQKPLMWVHSMRKQISTLEYSLNECLLVRVRPPTHMKIAKEKYQQSGNDMECLMYTLIYIPDWIKH